MRLVNWRRVRKGKLLGFVSVELAIGLQIHDCAVLNGPHVAGGVFGASQIRKSQHRHTADIPL
jgi:hypothetical protein